MLLSGVMGNAASLASWASHGAGEILYTSDWRGPRRLRGILNSDADWSASTLVSVRGRSDPDRHVPVRAHLRIKPAASATVSLTTGIVGGFVLRDGKRRGGDPAYKIAAMGAAALLHAGTLLMVVNRRDYAKSAAEVIAAELDPSENTGDLRLLLEARLGGGHPLIPMIRKGVAYHHAGLPVDVQEAIEDALRADQLRAVVSTSTLTDGVNLPVRTVVVAVSEYAGQLAGQRMDPARLLNAVGRAGRAGKESEGWIILALNKAHDSRDFDRLQPSDEDLTVYLSLVSGEALASLEAAEDLAASTRDGVLRLDPNGIASDFASYVWLVLATFDTITSLTRASEWTQVVRRLFAFEQLPEDQRARWIALADKVAVSYSGMEVGTRRRWARTGTSLTSAAILDDVVDQTVRALLGRVAAGDAVHPELVPVEMDLQSTFDVLDEVDAFDRLLATSEAGQAWRFRPTPRGDVLPIPVLGVLRDWVAGVGLPELADRHLRAAVRDEVFRLEQMVLATTEAFEFFLSWTVGVVVSHVKKG